MQTLMSPLDRARRILNIGATQIAMLVQRPEFSVGWESGVERNVKTLPLLSSSEDEGLDEMIGDKACLAGFIAGRHAEAHNLLTPECVIVHSSDDNSNCKCD